VAGHAQLCSVSHAQRFVGAAGEARVAAGVERVLAVGTLAHGEDPPPAGYALELVFSPFGKRESGADHEVLDRAGNEYFAGAGQVCDPGADVDGQPADIIGDELALAGVYPRAQHQV
jgi:hypothetical protein